jgi:hypothetical protein
MGYVLAIRALTLSIILALAGCSNGELAKNESPVLSVLKGASAMVFARRSGGNTSADATKALQAALAKIEGPAILGVIEATNLPVLLQPKGQNGANQTWVSPDKKSVTFNSGAILATRGFGGDLVAADVSALAQHIQARTPASYDRQFRFLGSQYEIRRATLNCVFAIKGAEEIKIVEQTKTLTHLVETCKDPGGGSFDNDFWVSSDGVVWQSRQWLGPTLGQIFLQRLRY